MTAGYASNKRKSARGAAWRAFILGIPESRRRSTVLRGRKRIVSDQSGSSGNPYSFSLRYRVVFPMSRNLAASTLSPLK